MLTMRGEHFPLSFGSVIFIEIAVLGVVFFLSNLFLSSKDSEIVCAPVIVLAVIIVFLNILLGCIGSDLFNATERYNQIGNIEKIEYSQMIEQVDTTQIPIVDEELARKQAEKRLGEDATLGSKVILGDGAIQDVNGEIMWFFPLDHTDFFKWRANKTTPGYITVSASNPNKVKYVKIIDDVEIKNRYMNSSYFGDDLTRHIRKQGFRTENLTEYTYELNNEGRPYWVITTYRNDCIWNQPEATGVIVVDVQTGETNKYTINDAPEWIDVIQPSKFIENQIDNYGRYVHGFWNLANTDELRKTDGVLTVFLYYRYFLLAQPDG